MRNLIWALNLLLLSAVLAIAPASAQPVKTSYVTAELITENQSSQPGQTTWVGLRLEMEPHWHTYWRFPGDSGLPTKVDWKLPPGWNISEPIWPLPARIQLPPLVNYGFEGEALLGFELQIPASTPAGSYALEAKASWLVCKQECIPEKADLKLSLQVGAGAPAPQNWASFFSALRAQQPVALPAENLGGFRVEAKRIGLEIRGPFPSGSIDFFPLESQLIKGTTPPKVEKGKGEEFTLWMEKAEPFSATAREFSGLLVGGKGSAQKVFAVNLPLPAVKPAAAPLASEDSSVWLAILFAFLGGVLLNLMPCVFPVLGIKVMSLVNQGKGDKWHARKHGKIYALGVVFSFWVLTASLLLLRSAGQSVGWGFQLQQPGFVLALIFLFSLLAANLAGFFELGGRFMGMGGSLANRDGASGSFFTGVLAVIVATPCTAPFMGTAIGVVLGQPAWAVFLVFTSLGLGLSAPFVLLSYQPALLALLPRPGVWMERLKEFFAFPLAATVLWLLWVLGMQIGLDGMIIATAGLLLLFAAIWVKRRFSGNVAKGFSWIILIGGVLLATSSLRWKANSGLSEAEGSWQKYSTVAVKAAVAEKKPVFVDFTAAWCLTCQINKSLVLDRPPMRDFFREKGVQLYRADWTNHDPEITKALEEHGRIGVPLYLAYPAGGGPAKVLSQILTETEVKQAFP
jgi:thiol:disulfide interchange protein